MNVRRRFTVLRPLLIAWLLLQWLQGIPGLALSRSDGQSIPQRVLLLDNSPVFSDFDGDHKVDRATLSSSGHVQNIQVAFGKSDWRSLSFDSNEAAGGRLISGDIDADGDIDLVWISQSSRDFVTFLGDGHGNFSIVTASPINLDRILALLEDGAPRLGGGADTDETAAVLLDSSFIVPVSHVYYLHLSKRASVTNIDVRSIAAPCLSILKQRGPPFELF